MSSIVDNKRTGKKYDRRVKLTDEEKEYIKKLYHTEKLPIREIARIFIGRCSRRLIQFIIFPERLKNLQKKHIEEKSHKKYYTKDKQKKYMRSHRKYKRKLLLDKKIK